MNNRWPKSDETPEPGDLIEIFRFVYQHWAVYVGDDYVVHVTSQPGAEVSGAVSNTFMSVPTDKAMVKKEKLEEVVGDNKCRINNFLDEKYEPRSPHIIVEEALGQVGNEMGYCVTSKNCEHFATKLRYGKAVSWQVIKAAVLAPFYGPVLSVGLPLLAVAAATLAGFVTVAEHFRLL